MGNAKTTSVGTIRGRDVKTRDWMLVRLLTGATKANVQLDRRKERSRKACRSWREE